MKKELNKAKKGRVAVRLFSLSVATFFVATALAITVANAATWVGPTQQPPAGNLGGFINNTIGGGGTQTASFDISGSGAVGTNLTVSQDSTVGGTLTVTTQLCLGSNTNPDNCKASWPATDPNAGQWGTNVSPAYIYNKNATIDSGTDPAGAQEVRAYDTGKLQVYGANDWIEFQVNNAQNYSEIRWGDDVGDRLRYYFWAPAAQDREVMTLLSNGNVGIGVNNPTFKLHVVGTQAGPGSNSLVRSQFENSDPTGGVDIQLKAGNNGTMAIGVNGISRNFPDAATNNWGWIHNNIPGGGIAFYTGTGDGYNNARMGISPVGNVGIGTVTSTDTRLVVKGASGSSGYVSIDADTNQEAGIQLRQNGTSKWWIYRSNGAGGATVGDLGIWRSGQSVDDLHIQSGYGYVGLGTMTPQARLDIAGTAKFYSNSANGGANFEIVNWLGGINNNNNSEFGGGGYRFNEYYDAGSTWSGTPCTPGSAGCGAMRRTRTGPSGTIAMQVNTPESQALSRAIGAMEFDLAPTGAANTLANRVAPLTLRDNGQIGILTTGPNGGTWRDGTSQMQDAALTIYKGTITTLSGTVSSGGGAIDIYGNANAPYAFDGIRLWDNGLKWDSDDAIANNGNKYWGIWHTTNNADPVRDGRNDFRINQYTGSGNTHVEALTIQSGTGNVGLGSTKPAQRLVVEGRIGIGRQTTGVTETLSNIGGSLYWGTTNLSAGAGATSGWTDSGTNVYLTTATDRVGIGTSLPYEDVDITASGSSNPAFIGLSGTPDGYQYSGIDLWNNGKNWTGNTLWRITHRQANASISPVADSFQIHYKDASNAWLTALTMVPSGSVGINTANPGGKLHVYSNTATAGTVNRALHVEAMGTGNQSNIAIRGEAQAGTSPNTSFGGFFVGGLYADRICLGAASNCITAWPTGGSASGWTDAGTYVQLQTSTDNVGIGTTVAPTQKLEVNGNILLSGASGYGNLVFNNGANRSISVQQGSSDGNDLTIAAGDARRSNVGGDLILNAGDTDTGDPGDIYIGTNVPAGDTKGVNMYFGNASGQSIFASPALFNAQTTFNSPVVANNTMTVGGAVTVNNNLTVNGSLGFDLRSKACDNLPGGGGIQGCSCSSFGSDYVILNGGAVCVGVFDAQVGGSYPSNDKVTWWASCTSGFELNIRITCMRVRDTNTSN